MFFVFRFFLIVAFVLMQPSVKSYVEPITSKLCWADNYIVFVCKHVLRKKMDCIRDYKYHVQMWKVNPCFCGPLTGASLLDKVTGTEVVRVDRDGFLSNPELSTGLLIGDWINLHFLSWNAWRNSVFLSVHEWKTYFIQHSLLDRVKKHSLF